MHEPVIATFDTATLSVLVAIVAPLVGVPLTVVTFYLRTIRDHQATRYSDTLQRIDAVESSIRDLTRNITELERDYTTKEEWLRESLHARRQLEHLTEMTARVQTEIENSHTTATQFARATDALVTLARQLAGARPTDDGESTPPEAD
jgi:predicted transcriptional regulator